MRVHPVIVGALLVAAGFVVSSASRAQAPGNQSVVNSPHNLSASGPGTIHASGEQEVCIFCHTPHNASPVQPLWNRNVPASAYTVYSSNSLQAKPGQPTGSSKLCLSCHDGTIALGSVTSRMQPIGMAAGITTLPPGASNLGTDLSDDHPISFRYDASLAAKNPKLKAPHALPPGVRLDPNSEMQCTSCHEAHDDSRGNFLVMDNTASQLCNACHTMGTTTVPRHEQCGSCHVSHTSPSGPYLLKAATVTDTCLTCHNGQTSQAAGPNVGKDLLKLSRHDTHSAVNLKDHAPANVTCTDCHEAHTMKGGGAAAPLVAANLGAVGGVNVSGVKVTPAQFGYEVCFKCHADRASVAPAVSRKIVQNNTRLEFEPSAVSFHPVAAPGKNQDVPSLRTGYNTASVIGCVDCHTSDTGRAAVGGAGASGPHGSNNAVLLANRYETADNTVESADAYALCYKCHDRASILNSPTFPQHKTHVVDFQASCATCHDAHGISAAQGTAQNNSKLINFNTSIVGADPVTKRLEYVSLGARSGQCFLSCHGAVHTTDPATSVYPSEQGALGGAARKGARKR